MPRHENQRLVTLAAVLAAVWLLSVGRGALADEYDGSCNLNVYHRSKELPPTLVQVYRGGKRIRMADLKFAQGLTATGYTVNWKLAPGSYEVRFEAPDYKAVTKRITLPEIYELNVSLAKEKPAILGDGPSLQELEKRIQQLEQANAELRAELEKLKKK